jgi:hypothetical protein
MKPRNLLLIGAAATALFSSCKGGDDPTPVVPTGDTVYLRGTITSDMTLQKSKTYFLRGYVYVDGGTLTIEPGTTIYSKKDSAGVLIVYKGAKINAAGDAAIRSFLHQLKPTRLLVTSAASLS